MVRHISVFTLKEDNKAENILRLIEMLETVQNQCTLSCGGTATRGIPAGPTPLCIEDGPVFGDVIQILDFPSEKEAADYPACDAHKRLLAESSFMMDHVTSIDFRCDHV